MAQKTLAELKDMATRTKDRPTHQEWSDIFDTLDAGSVNVKAFEDLVVNGDWTAAVHAARDSGAKELFFADETYLVAGLDASVADQTWRLSSGATIKLAVDATLLSVTAEGVRLIGGTWDGDSLATGVIRAIDVTANDFQAEGVTFLNAANDAVYLEGASDCIIRNNRFEGNNRPIFIEASASAHARNNLVDGNFIVVPSGTDNDGVQVHSTNAGFDVSGTRIVNNYIEIGSANGFGIEVGRFLGDVPDRIVISGNSIKATATCLGGISVDKIANSTITGNAFDSNGQTISVAGIELTGADACTVTGNSIKGDNGCNFGIVVGSDSGTSNDNVISGNVVDGFSNVANDDCGITLETSEAGEVKRNIVIGNMIRFPAANAGVSYRGIQVRENNASADVSDNLVIGNIIFGNGDTACRGIQVVAANALNTRTTVADNVIIDTATGIFNNGSNLNATRNRMHSVTTEYSDSGTNSIIDRYDQTNLATVLNKLGVSNGAAATTLGTVTDRIEVFDAAGASLGFVPVYDAIT